MTVVKLAERDAAYRKEVVGRLEALLQAAKDGEILSIVYACERPGNEVTVGCSRIKDRYVILGYLAHLQYMTSLSIHDDSVPSEMLDDPA